MPGVSPQTLSFGVSKGRWKDYAIDFTTYAAYFHFYKNTSERPIISIMKNKGRKNKRNNYKIHYGTREIMLSNNLDNLFTYINRTNISLVKK